MLKRLYLILLAALAVVSNTFARSNDNTDTTRVYVFSINDMITKATARLTKRSFEEAARQQADIILIHMNTYGGLVDAADSVRTRILNSEIPVYVFIDNNAASAGALISIACDSIYMRAGANIGAATVVDQSGNVVPDKFQSYMRSTMRSTAQAHGKDTVINGADTIIKWKRDPSIAEAMVDPVIYIPGVIDSGKVLTFTADEAIANGYCEGKAENITEVLKVAGIGQYKIISYRETAIDRIIGFLLNPAIQGILIMLIIGGIYFELQTPGIGFPLIAAATAALLYFAPLYLEGLAEHWEVLIFLAGLVLIGLEIFVIPGFGVAGISGIILVVGGLSLAMIDNVIFEFDWRLGMLSLVKALFVVVTSVSLSVILMIFFSKHLLGTRFFKGIALEAVQDKNEGYVGVDMQAKSLTGAEGLAFTVLRPGGKVEIDGQVYDAISEYGFIQKGEPVKITRFESGQLYVIKA